MPLIIRSFINLVLIKYIVSEIEGDFDIVWSFDPYRLQNLRIFKSEKTIYHPVDIHESNREVDITNAADYIFCPSLAISKRIKCVSNKKYISFFIIACFN